MRTGSRKRSKASRGEIAISVRPARRSFSLLLAIASLLAANPAAATETTRDPYASCVAVEAARQPGSVTAEARARQKCRKLYPSETLPRQPDRPLAPPVVPAASPLASPSGTSSTLTPDTPSTPTTGTPVALPAPAPEPMPASSAGGNPHGGPPGLSK